MPHLALREIRLSERYKTIRRRIVLAWLNLRHRKTRTPVTLPLPVRSGYFSSLPPKYDC